MGNISYYLLESWCGRCTGPPSDCGRAGHSPVNGSPALGVNPAKLDPSIPSQASAAPLSHHRPSLVSRTSFTIGHEDLYLAEHVNTFQAQLLKREFRDVGTITDVCYSENVPEVEIFSLLEEGVPRYTLRADAVYGYSHDDWLHTPLVSENLNICLTPQQIEETLKYFLLCAERVGQVTKTYHDIEAVTHLLEEKERDLELAARIGQSLLKQNRELTDSNEYLEEQLQRTTEEVAQLKHEVSMRDDLLQLYTNSTEESEPSSSCGTPLRRNESSVSLQSYLHLEMLQQKLRNLESENHRLKHKALQLSTETLEYENKEEELVMNCVKELGESNNQLASVSEELARKIEDSARQQEEISVLLAQVVELQQKCRACTTENEELTQELAMSRESQEKLQTELKYLREKYLQCGEMLREAQDEMKNLRNQSVPNSCINRYLTVPIYPMDSLAAEIEGTMRKGFHVDGTGSVESSNYHRRVFETVRAVNQAVKMKSRSQSPQNIPGSGQLSSDPSGSSSLFTTPCTSLHGSNSPSSRQDDRFQSPNPDTDSVPDEDVERKLGTPGTPGCRDLEAALQRLSLRQETAQDRTILEQEREQKLKALISDEPFSSGILTPAESVLSTGTNYSGSSGQTAYSGLSVSSRPDKLKIVKPLEGSVTLHQWKQLAQPNLGGILEPRPGVLTKDFCQLDTDVGEVYNLNDFEEDETDFTLFQHLTAPLPEQPLSDFNGVAYRSTNRLPDTQSTYTITTCRIMHPSELSSVTMSSHHTPKPSCGNLDKLRPTSSDENLHRLRPISSCGNFNRFRPIPSSGSTVRSNTLGSTVSSTSFEELRIAHSVSHRRRCLSESATNLREHTTTMSTSLGLVTLLKEHGISAAVYDLVSSTGLGAPSNHQHPKGTLPDCQHPGIQLDCPPTSPFELKYTHPPQQPFLTTSLAKSMLRGMGPMEDGRSASDHSSERNIFSFNLVEKLKRLGLDKVVARGRVHLENKRLMHLPRTPST
ncbi:trafficking kinesin-binding protein 1-like [Pristis pectinata]|uniref:trafficking kinesin-binding protein 1-like n=1 Tax=Pristis pectinata TaxID=685728 RepID=UPI00223E64DA|nr:trafficking kinesin-binding protein 1-like [Pristis pectinata]